MRINVLIGGKAGQGINKVSEIVANTLNLEGLYVFNYRDYPSLIRGGHNFNILSVSEKPIGSHESKLDGMIAVDEATKKLHRKELKKKSFVVDYLEYPGLGRNLNIALAGALARILGAQKKNLLKVVQAAFNNKNTLHLSLDAARLGYDKQDCLYEFKSKKERFSYMSGSSAIAKGAVDSKMDMYIAYPMTPATNTMHELASLQLKNGHKVVQPEGETAAINMALGASFAGARVMVGTSGGGFDLMSEGLSMQGMAELPLVVYLASRSGPGTGIPTYTQQSDINIALHAGHGEFPRIVIAPGDPIEAIENTNEAFYLANKHNALSVILSDKHLAESEFTSAIRPNKPLKFRITRKLPGRDVVKASSYEHDNEGITTEDAKQAEAYGKKRIQRYKDIEKSCRRFDMFKLHGKGKNLVVGFGSTKHAILDAIDGLDYAFLQILYLAPFPDISNMLKRAKSIVLVENNLTGQLGELIRQKTGVDIRKKILRFDGRPFTSDELRRRLR